MAKTLRSEQLADNISSANAYVGYPVVVRDADVVKVLVRNNGDSNAIDYKVDGYVYRAEGSGVDTNSAEAVTAETEIGTEANAVTDITNNVYDRVVVSVKSSVAGDHSTYDIFVNHK